MTKPNNEHEEEVSTLDEDELALLARNLNRYFRFPKNEQNSSRPNNSQNIRGSINPRGNQQNNRQNRNT